MTRITPSQFSDAFLRVISAAQAECLARWHAKPEFTSYMRQTILPGVASFLGVQVYARDYYTLDCVFFADRDTEFFGECSTYAKCLSVALEHENEISGTAIEMNKLQLFNVPLKVLITYADAPSKRTSYLEHYAKIVQAADIFGDFSKLRRQLVVFGSRDDCNAYWHFYAYEEDRFRELAIDQTSDLKAVPSVMPVLSRST